MKIIKRNLSRPEKYFLASLLGLTLLGIVLVAVGATYQKASTFVDER